MKQVQHIKRFDGGRRTPQEYHNAFAFPPGAKCSGCKARPQVRAIVMVSAKDAERMGWIPPGAGANPRAFPEIVPVLVKLREGGPQGTDYVRVSVAYACSVCAPEMERTLAKAPSWAVVEIGRGPDPTNRVSLGAG